MQPLLVIWLIHLVACKMKLENFHEKLVNSDPEVLSNIFYDLM